MIVSIEYVPKPNFAWDMKPGYHSYKYAADGSMWAMYLTDVHTIPNDVKHLWDLGPGVHALVV